MIRNSGHQPIGVSSLNKTYGTRQPLRNAHDNHSNTKQGNEQKTQKGQTNEGLGFWYQLKERVLDVFTDRVDERPIGIVNLTNRTFKMTSLKDKNGITGLDAILPNKSFYNNFGPSSHVQTSPFLQASLNLKSKR